VTFYEDILTVLQVIHVLRKKEEMVIKSANKNYYTNDNIENDNKNENIIDVINRITKKRENMNLKKLVTKNYIL
jgi:hypothetical protein